MTLKNPLGILSNRSPCKMLAILWPCSSISFSIYVSLLQQKRGQREQGENYNLMGNSYRNGNVASLPRPASLIPTACRRKEKNNGVYSLFMQAIFYYIFFKFIYLGCNLGSRGP